MWRSAALAVILASSTAGAIKLDVTRLDVERALAIARSSDAERARFHAPYIVAVDTPFVDRVELISPYRRVVLLAEQHISKGDRAFAYSITRAYEASRVWSNRVAVVARVRFHPQNVYVTLPQVDIAAEGHAEALIGVLKEPVFGFDPAGTGAPILGATVEGVFDAQALGQADREFVISLENEEIARVTFPLGALE